MGSLYSPRTQEESKSLFFFRRLLQSELRNITIFVSVFCRCEGFDSLGHTTVFSTLEDCSGYWQIDTEVVVKDKTADLSRQGFYGFIRMPLVHENPLAQSNVL